MNQVVSNHEENPAKKNIFIGERRLK